MTGATVRIFQKAGENDQLFGSVTAKDISDALNTKEFWRRNPLPNTSQGLDCRFLWNRRPKRVATMPDERFYVATIHTGNTSRKDTTRSLWKETAVAEVHELLGDDLAFYRDAANLGP